MHRARRIVFGAILTLLAALPSNGQGRGYDLDQIVALTKELGKAQDWPEEKISDLVINIKKAAEGDIYKQEVAPKGVVGVFAYRATEAGLVVKIMRGTGLVTFTSGRKAAEITLRSTSVGAQVGGSAEWGVGMIVGLKKDTDFGGEYSGAAHDAVVGDDTSTIGALLTSTAGNGTDPHAIFVVKTGRGFSANAGGTKLTITRSW